MALRTAGESEFCQGVALRCETGKYGAVRANAGIQATLDMGMSAADVGAALDVRRLELPPPWRRDQHAFSGRLPGLPARAWPTANIL